MTCLLAGPQWLLHDPSIFPHNPSTIPHNPSTIPHNPSTNFEYPRENSVRLPLCGRPSIRAQALSRYGRAARYVGVACDEKHLAHRSCAVLTLAITELTSPNIK